MERIRAFLATARTERRRPARDRRARCRQDRPPERRSGGGVGRGHAHPPRRRRRVRGRDELFRPEPAPPPAPGRVAAAPGGPPGRPQRRARLRRRRAPEPARRVQRGPRPAAAGSQRPASARRPGRPAVVGPGERGRAELRRAAPRGQPGRVARCVADGRGGLLRSRRAARAGGPPARRRGGRTAARQPVPRARAGRSPTVSWPRRRGTHSRCWSSRSRSARECAPPPPRCLPRCRSAGGSSHSTGRGSPGFRLGPVSSCCSWRSMAPATCASWRAERHANAGFRDLAAAEEARLAYVDQATHRLAFHHPLIRSAVVDLSHAEERRSAHRVLAERVGGPARPPGVASRRGGRRAGRVGGGPARGDSGADPRPGRRRRLRQGADPRVGAEPARAPSGSGGWRRPPTSAPT